jgi:DNA-binding CsgD family transcriptional regulator
MRIAGRVSSDCDLMSKVRTSAHQSRHPQSLAAKKVRQSTSIREIANALTASGFCTLDEQARALGISRSTAWTILKSPHKASGLSAKLISHMLTREQLPPLARDKFLEYVDEKAAGNFGHSVRLRRKFVTALAATSIEEIVHLRKDEPSARSPQKRVSVKKTSDVNYVNGGSRSRLVGKTD